MYRELLQRPMNRKHVRRAYGYELRFVVDDKKFVARIRDISIGGLFIETVEKFSVGQVVKLEIPMVKSARVFRRTGVIVRIVNDGIGIKLTQTKNPEE